MVDDQADVRRMLVGGLRSYLGVEVAEADGGAAALELLRRGAFALVLTDIEMPGMDGCKFIRRLRADPAGRGLRVLAMSGGARGDEALAAGCDEFVPKPIRGADLAERVRRWLPVDPVAMSDRPRWDTAMLTDDEIARRTPAWPYLTPEERASVAAFVRYAHARAAAHAGRTRLRRDAGRPVGEPPGRPRRGARPPSWWPAPDRPPAPAAGSRR